MLLELLLHAAADTSKYPFCLSESLVSRGDSKVLINISLPQLVRRDQIEPIIAAGEGGGVLGPCRPPSALSFDHERSCLRSHADSEAWGRFRDSGMAI